jgi:serine/threonine protein kinase
MADTSLGGQGTTTSTAVAGAVRWMAPELLAPSEFGLDSARKTFKSDVYALGCVAIEVGLSTLQLLTLISIYLDFHT